MPPAASVTAVTTPLVALTCKVNPVPVPVLVVVYIALSTYPAPPNNEVRSNVDTDFNAVTDNTRTLTLFPGVDPPTLAPITVNASLTV